MTVSTENSKSAPLAWTGVETSFAPGFSALDVSHVLATFVAASGVETLLTRGVHFSVTLGTGGAVTVTPIALPPAPGSLIISRRTPALQSVAFGNLGSFAPSVHESLADAAAMRDAELRQSLPYDLPAIAAADTGKVLAVLNGAAHKLGLIVPDVALLDQTNVKTFGAKGDGVASDTAAVQAAIAYSEANGGGIVFFPPGSYYLPGGIVVSTSLYSVRLVGAGVGATILRAQASDTTVVTLGGSHNSMEELTVFGKGLNDGAAAFGATQPAVIHSCDLGYMRNCRIWGGSIALNVTGTDNMFENVEANISYGASLISTTGSNWYVRCKFDLGSTSIGLTNAYPYPAWAAATVYTVGLVVSVGGYLIQCSVAGTSGAVAPALKQYGQPIVDGTGTLRWLLLAPVDYTSFYQHTGAAENRMVQCDFSGSAFRHSVRIDAAGSWTNLTDCVCSSLVTLTAGSWFTMKGTTIGGDIAVAATWGNIVILDGNIALAPVNISFGAGLQNFVVVNNNLAGGMITVAPGASDKYVIANNLNATVSDGGTGLNKRIEAVAVLRTINANNVALPAHIAQTLLQIGGSDGQNIHSVIDAWGIGVPSFDLRRARNTAAAPAALQLSDVIGQIAFFGYGATGYSATNRASVRGVAAENWTDANQGVDLTFNTTPTGTATAILAFSMFASGGASVGIAPDPGINNFGLKGALKFSGSTSGTGQLVTPAIVGAPTWTLPTGSGTFAVAASSPIALSAAGNLTLGVDASLGVSGVNLQRAALTGDVTAAAGSNATTIANNAVSNAKFRAGAALSLVGVAGNAGANVADIAAAADGNVMRRSGAAIGFGTIGIATAGTHSDYEEGSWTPVIQGGTTPGTQTYSIQVGRYVRIGNMVWVSGGLFMTAKDAATAGTFQIGGFPFASSNIVNMQLPFVVRMGSVDFSAGYTVVALTMLINSTVANAAEWGDNVATQALTAAAITATTFVSFSGWYRIN